MARERSEIYACQVVMTFREKHNGGTYEKGWLGNLHFRKGHLIFILFIFLERVILESLTEKGTLDSRLPVSQTHQELVVLRAFAQPEMLFLQISKAFPHSLWSISIVRPFPNHLLLPLKLGIIDI